MANEEFNEDAYMESTLAELLNLEQEASKLCVVHPADRHGFVSLRLAIVCV